MGALAFTQEAPMTAAEGLLHHDGDHLRNE
jgi:hypothetical protein